jgi:hypothetical protein
MGTDVAGTELGWIEAIAQSFERHPFVEFNRATLPAMVAEHGHLVRDNLRGAEPLTFRIPDDTTYTWGNSSRGVWVEEGDTGDSTVVELSERTFSECVDELLTASGAERTGRARVTRGGLPGWQRWEPALQSLLSGREIYGPAVWQTLVDGDGAALDLHRAFSVDDDLVEMGHFLAVAGYLHIKSVFTPEEIGRWQSEVEHARAHTSPGDPFSWWSVNSEGAEVVTRINYLGRYSTVLEELSFDERLAHYARLAGPDLRVCHDRLDGPMVFIKNSNVVKGNGDLGWHTDDGLGGHPVMCPLVQAGIQLDHDTTPPPTADRAGRRALYYKFAEPKTFEWIPSACHYNDALFRADPEGRVANRATTWAVTP